MPIRLVLDNVRSGQNVGACFRSGDAFRIEGLDLCGITCHPPHRDILKSALGSSGHVPWRPWDNTLDGALPSSGRMEGGGGAGRRQHVAHEWQPASNEKWALVLGNEVRGVSPEVLDLCDVVLEMPQYGVKQSINVSVCAGVVLWQAALHLRHA